MAQLVRGGCLHDCTDSCAWIVTVESGRAVRMVGDPEHPYTRGTLCAKVDRYLDRVYSPDRVLTPLRRVGVKGEGHFEPVTWAEALAEIGDRLGRLAAVAPESILPFSFAGNMGLIQTASLDRRFFNLLGASELERTICGATANAGVVATIGRDTGILPEDVVRSRYIVIWGSNTLVTNLHLWKFIREAREAGAKLVVIDPVRTRTAAAADWHLQPWPGSDAALALGLINAIVAAGYHDQDYLDRYCTGFEQLLERAREYPPARVEQLTGIPAGDLERLAREYATVRPAVIRTMVGPEKHAQGADLLRAIACLPAVVGAWREPGGGLLHWTKSLVLDGLDLDALARPDLRPGPVRTINMTRLGRALTDPLLDPPVRALFVYNSNPLLTMPNAALIERGLRRDDLFTVVHDLFVTETARYADLLLPAASFIECEDLTRPFGMPYLTLNRPAIAPPGEAVSNTELFRRLASAMGLPADLFQVSDEALIRIGLSRGSKLVEGITYERLLERGSIRFNLPEPYVPFAEGGFPTASGRCELYSEGLAAAGLDPLPSYRPVPRPAGFPLLLVSAKYALHHLNSSYSHLPRHAAAEGAPRLDIHPRDAAARGIADGSPVRMWNRAGEVLMLARIGEQVPAGVVAAPYSHPGPGLGALDGRINRLTSDAPADRGGGPAIYDTWVEVMPEAARAASSGTVPTVSLDS